MCLIPGLLGIGKPGLYFSMEVLNYPVWTKLVHPLISMAIGAVMFGSMAAIHFYRNPDKGFSIW